MLPLFESSAEFLVRHGRLELARLIERQQIILSLDEEPTSDFRVDVNHEIHVSLEKLQRLWATLFAYTVIHDLQKITRGAPVLESTSDGRQAKSFLDWAFGDPATPWPQHLPRPDDRTTLTDNTNGLFRCSSGFILLHEIGHCALKHTSNPALNPNTKIRREYQADDWAVRQVIAGHSDGVPLQFWTAIGMTLGVIGALELYGELGDVRNHPRPVMRMYHFFAQHFFPSDRDTISKAGVLAAMLTPVQAHLARRGLPMLSNYETMGDFWVAADAAYPS